jgi:hypothetical protein
MIEILRFTFQSFWHWLGMVILLGAIFGPLGTALGKRK